jgi:hypothetical protein
MLRLAWTGKLTIHSGEYECCDGSPALAHLTSRIIAARAG